MFKWRIFILILALRCKLGMRQLFKNISFSTILSVALVLFLYGIIILLILLSKEMANHYKEQIKIDVYFKSDVPYEKIQRFNAEQLSNDLIKKLNYITPEDAKDIYIEKYGEAYLLDELDNFFPASSEIFLVGANMTEELMSGLVRTYEAESIVESVHFKRDLVKKVNSNIAQISWFVFGFSVLLLVVCIALINSTIRISIYSDRLLIRSMQLVGATKSFISKPFLVKSVIRGLIAAVLSVLMIYLFIFLIESKFEVFAEYKVLNFENIMLIALSNVLLGVLIAYFSTFFAMKKYLRLKTDKLF